MLYGDMMKKIFTFTLIIFILIVLISCQQELDQVSIINEQTPIPSPTQDVISEIDFSDMEQVYISIDPGKWYNVYYKTDSDWISYIKETYKIELFFSNYQRAYNVSDYLKHRIPYSGFYLASMTEFFTSYDIFDNYFKSMEQLLINSESWNSLPKDYRENGIVNDLLCFIPYDYQQSSFQYRIYNKESLDNYNNGVVPQDTIDFLEYAMNIKQSGTSNLIIPFFHNDNLVCNRYLYDIFWAYEVPMSDGFSSIRYDKATNQFEDMANSAKMTEALLYIRELVENDILDSTIKDNILAETSDGYFVSCLVSEDEILYSSLEFEVGLFSNIVYPVKTYSDYGYFLLKDTEDKVNVVNRFIDAFLSSSQNNIVATLGFEEINYITNNNYTNITYPVNSILGQVVFNSEIVDSFSNKKSDIETYFSWQSNLSEITDNITLIPIDLKQNFIYSEANSRKIINVFYTVYEKYLLGEYDMDEAHNIYKTLSKRSGIERYMYYLNEKVSN